MAIELVSKTWLERVEANRFDPWTKERMIGEMPHTYFIGYLPVGLAFLQGRFVDLGFENLGLSPQELRRIMMAFGGTGVCIPGTQLRMRFAYPHAVIEPVDGSETATLPSWWKEGVLVTGTRAKRIKITGPTLPRIDPSELAAALGAEPCGERRTGQLDPISLAEIGNELLKRRRSTGAAPEPEEWR